MLALQEPSDKEEPQLNRHAPGYNSNSRQIVAL